MFVRRLLPIFVIASSALGQSPGEAVLRRMHDAYAGRWYSTLRFVQKTTQYRADGSTNIATWYESLRQTRDGVTQLRIDLGDPSAGNGTLYTADSTWVLRAGKLTATRPSGNEFLPLIEGVYVQPVEKTARQVSAMGVDLAKSYETQWQGRATSVIGAESTADSTSSQVWIDHERNVVVRALLGAAPSRLAIELTDYVKVGDGWLATLVQIWSGGRKVQTENYADWKVGIDLPDDIFRVEAWVPKAHWANR
jgi:hypothetical protein